MPFTSGRVTYCKFQVQGDAPATVDEAMLSILSEHRFRESGIGTPDEVEAGFVTAEHLLDTQFTFEKVAFGVGNVPGTAALLAMRVDTHKVPSDVKAAYRKINENAAAAASATGFASKAEKRDAKELAARQMEEDLAAGKFRRSKSTELLWDLTNKTLYCAAAGTTVIEHLVRLMRNAFSCDLQYQSAGVAAGEFFRADGKQRDYEDVQPSAFTAPPPEALADHESFDGPRNVNIPQLPWIAQATDLKDYLGNEWLLWLWWLTETDDGNIPGTDLFVAITAALDMDCAWGVRGKQSLRGEIVGGGPTRLPEAGDALAHGKWPRKAGLIVSDGESQWELTLQADKLIASSIKLPEIEDAPTPRELLEQRLQLTLAAARALDDAYAAFLKQRTSGGWPSKRESIGKWIKQRVKARQPAAASASPGVVVLADAPPAPKKTETIKVD